MFKLNSNSVKGVNEAINLKYNFNSSFKINNYIIKKYLVDHGRMKLAFEYVFEYKSKKVGFTGDSVICKNVEFMVSICEYLFCDCMFIKGTIKHMGIGNIKYLSEKYPECKFVVSHLEDETRGELKKLKIKNVIIQMMI